MKERPILFSDAMVRAILDGRKTQTRRVITKWSGPKLSPGNGANQDGYCTVEDHTIAQKPWTADLISRLVACPYGERGDRLWVREAFMLIYNRDGGRRITYKAEGHYFVIHAGNGDDDWRGDYKWTPSIHMPRWASRILLEITNIRVERAHEISEQDAIAEGITGPHHVGYPAYRVPGDSKPRFSNPVSAFEDLWDSIYAARGYGWDVNPWVWVIEFRRIK